MPTKQLESWAKEAGKTIEEAEKYWEECKKSALKEIGVENDAFWAYVNTCVRSKLGLKVKVRLNHSHEQFSIFKKW